MTESDRKNIEPHHVGRALGSLVFSCLKGLVGLVHRMDRENISEYMEEGEADGKTASGEDIKIKYHYGVKIGLDAESHKKKLRADTFRRQGRRR